MSAQSGESSSAVLSSPFVSAVVDRLQRVRERGAEGLSDVEIFVIALGTIR